MRSGIARLAVLVLLALPASAKPNCTDDNPPHCDNHFKSTLKWIGRHKMLLASDAALFAATAADIHTTERCIHAGTCVEANTFLVGRTPTTGQLWRKFALFDSGIVVFDHVAFHYMNKWADTPQEKLWLPLSANGWAWGATISHGRAAYHNAQASVRPPISVSLQSARARIMRPR